MSKQPDRQVGAVMAQDDGSVPLLRRKPADFMGRLYEPPAPTVSHR
jgi:hypothetical protein